MHVRGFSNDEVDRLSVGLSELEKNAGQLHQSRRMDELASPMGRMAHGISTKYIEQAFRITEQGSAAVNQALVFVGRPKRKGLSNTILQPLDGGRGGKVGEEQRAIDANRWRDDLEVDDELVGGRKGGAIGVGSHGRGRHVG